jgi:cAMP phosphodiesterase
VDPVRASLGDLRSKLSNRNRTFLVSHAHLDHVNGLILGAGATASPVPRHIAALESVIRDLESVFDGQKLWPRLARRKEEPVLSHGYVYDS